MESLADIPYALMLADVYQERLREDNGIAFVRGRVKRLREIAERLDERGSQPEAPHMTVAHHMKFALREFEELERILAQAEANRPYNQADLIRNVVSLDMRFYKLSEKLDGFSD